MAAVVTDHLPSSHPTPAINVMVRLEMNSNHMILAVHWLKVVEKQREHALASKSVLHKSERRFVSNRLNVMI